jgi:hypothetical protein
MYINKFLKLLMVIFLLLVVTSCGNNEDKPPVEVLKFGSGIITDIDGKKIFTETEDVPYKSGQIFGWYMYIRSNTENIKLFEVLHLSDVGVWSNSNNIIVSNDRKSAGKVKDETNTGYIKGGWSIVKGDPKGKSTIDVYINNKIIHSFHYNVN